MWLFHIFLKGLNIEEKRSKENGLGRTFGELISFNSKLCVMQKKTCQYILHTRNIC
jgi:hypothetical protein